MTRKGIFIAFEGLDGSGKTTQLKALRDYMLEGKNTKCREEREPSDGLLGLMARGAIKKKISFAPQTMALLFAADRYEHIINDIKPYLEQGIHVLTDRFVFSNFAYQGAVCDFDTIYRYNKASMDLLMPDLTIFIDTGYEKSIERIGETRIGKELYDSDGSVISKNFHKAIGWLAEKGIVEIVNAPQPIGENVRNQASKVLIIEGNQPEIVISHEIIKNVEPLLWPKCE